MIEKKTMLIVDDLKVHREILVTSFKEDYLILQASDADEALEIIKIAKVNVLIINIHIEGMGGMELIRKVRAIPERAFIPIVAVIEREFPDRTEALVAGADELIIKPIDLIAVRSQVNNLVLSKKSGTAEVFSAIGEQPSGIEENLQRMMKYIPGGVIMYRWDGKKLNALYISNYYAKNYASSMLEKGTIAGRPDFQRVHPDDVENLQKAILYALKTTHKLTYVYRAWDDDANRYLWKKLNAVSEELGEDGTCYVYAIYTDVTKEIDAKLEVEKNHEILKASIAASGQFCFEFDPTTDIMICPTEQAKIFDLPADYMDFPESLFAVGGILEEARPIADDLMNKLHHGVPEAECELRMYTKGVYLWYRFCFHAWDDPVKGYPIYLCSFANINAQKVAEEKYIQQMEGIARLANDALAFSKINVTKNICYVGTSNSTRISALQQQGQGKLDLCFAETEKYISDPSERELFHHTFALTKLMNDYRSGITHISLEYRFLIEGEQSEWVETIVDLVENPSTLDIEGYVSARSIDAKKMEEMILQMVIERDCHVLIYFDRYQDEYMMFDNQTKQYFVKQDLVYTNGVELGLSYASEEEKVRLKKELTKEKIIKKLSEGKECSFFYEGADHRKRYELILSNVMNDDRLVIGVLRDVTDEMLLKKLTYESEHDLLTGLYNRKKSFAECNRLLEEHPTENFAMVQFDIQRFRLYNSFFGEKEGDRLLKYIADMYRELSNTHKYGVYGRIEADVFLLCFSYTPDIIEKNKKYIHRHLLNYRKDFQVSGSCGIYIVKDRSLSAEKMFNLASLASKNNRNKLTQPISFFNDAMEKQLHIQQEIEKEMQTAIDEEQFEVYLQPKYILFSGEPYGAEALVRWQHPQKGMISPGDFIPLFETNGFITTLDQYMWEHTCQLIRKWIDSGYEPTPISVNVSRVSMYSPRIVPYLIALIQKYEIPVQLLNLELTESAYMDDPEEMKERLNELRKAGFSIMMDDFGSGYSSLNTLREIPVDYLKVDRAFLASVDRDKRSRLVLASVVHMASRMGIPVITEGVETDEQREFLTSIGSDYVQGYLYARPMPVTEYEKNILSRNVIVPFIETNSEVFISKITMNMDTEVQAFSNLLPQAVAFVDYVEDEFSYLSANKVFQMTFGMHRDVEDMSELLAHHITEKDYERLTAMYRKIADNHCSGECFISWKNNQNCTMYYLVKAQYIGKSAYSTIMVTMFIDLTQSSKQTISLTESTQALLTVKDTYTIKEIDNYVRMLDQIFDIARLVRPKSMQVFQGDAKDKLVCEPGRCYSFWGKSEHCKNCTALESVLSHRNSYKIEKRENDYYLIVSHPINLDVGSDKPVRDYVVETLTKLTDGVLDSLKEEKQLVKEEKIRKLQELIYEDPLTMVYNRRFFRDMKFLKTLNPGYKTGDGIAFVMIDLNGFKKINDTCGHAVGDQILIQIADMLRKRIRQTDSVIRYGGDEFLIVFHNCSEQMVQMQISGIHEALSEIRYAQEQIFPLDANIGYSYRYHFSGGFAEATEMIKEADHAVILTSVHPSNY